eukprot:scaffold3486_cov17-Tisochrysis_lutea.AAC.1
MVGSLGCICSRLRLPTASCRMHMRAAQSFFAYLAGFAKQCAVPPEVPASAGSVWELGNIAQQGVQPLPPALNPTAVSPPPPTSFPPGSISSIVAPQHPSPAPLSGAQAAVLAYQDAEVKELACLAGHLNRGITVTYLGHDIIRGNRQKMGCD